MAGVWGFDEDILTAPDTIERAYVDGVPMGGEISFAPKGVSPSFVVIAMKDPVGANLDRIQIIKAWVDAAGDSHEMVFDVVASDERAIDSTTGKLPAVGNTVDGRATTYTNTIGDASLATVWTDPVFDANQEALYYARVIEIPTPRWSTFDAKTLGVEPVDPFSIQERAITSAIWYAPK